ncbi:MAG: type VI secretion system-associated protein TagF [Paracoccaceae bacterium]
MGRFVYGKHPAFGDFLTAGLSDAAQNRIEAWLNASLQTLRNAWGEAWQDGFDASPPIAFWIGARVAGQAALRGAMLPSRDKVGRRFPLLAGTEGPGPLPPAVDPTATYGAEVAAILAELDPDPEQGAQGVIAGLPEVDGEDVDADPAFWAARDDGDTAQLWADVAFADHLRAAHGRSYWWVATAPTALYATDGLPPAEALAWLMTGGRPLERPGETTDEPATVEVE